MSRFRVFSAICLIGTFLGAVSAQEFSAPIPGTITDPSGSRIAGVDLQAINNSTQQIYSTKTNSTGTYFIPYVLPGNYTVNAKAPGFKTFVQENVTIEGGVTRGLNIALQLGVATETVEVTTAPPLI